MDEAKTAKAEGPCCKVTVAVERGDASCCDVDADRSGKVIKVICRTESDKAAKE